MLRFGVVGCGAIGPTHAGAIRQLGHDVAAVVDPIEARGRELAAKFGVRRVYERSSDLLVDPDVDAVCLCTPSGLHAEQGVAALRAGKHLIIEKPMEVSREACDRLIAAQRHSGRVLTVIREHRFDPATQLARQLIDQGAIGRLILASASVHWWRTQQYYDSGDWRGTWRLDGGGALMNQGIHTVDLLQWLGGGVANVFAHTRTSAHKRIEVEDIAAAVLTFTCGAVGSLTATTAAFDGFPVRIELFGTKGSIVLEGDTIKRIVLKDGRKYDQQDASEHAVRVARGGTASVKDDVGTDAIDKPRVELPAWNWGDAHRAQIADFIHAVQTGGRPLIDAVEGRRPVDVVLAVYQSARDGRSVEVDGRQK